MAKEKKAHSTPPDEVVETKEEATAVPQEPAADPAAKQDNAAQDAPQTPSVEEQLRQELAQQKDSYLRLAAEYDNFRKRSQRERDNLYTEIRAETVGKFLPVYDNLERALAQETADEAYKKGVEMTMTGLKEILEKLGVTIFGEAGEPFDPARHNAVMHLEDESLGENVVVEVFQKGFSVGDKVVRFAMVKVAN